LVCRTYEFTVGIRELGGQSLNVDLVYLDGVKYTGKQFFGTSRLKANGSLSKKVSDFISNSVSLG
jgi:hypothetical protein